MLSLLFMLLMLLISSLAVRGRLSHSTLATSCSGLAESKWNKRDVAAHLKSWLRGQVTIR